MDTISDSRRAGIRAMWMAGDFGQIAQYGARAAEQLVSSLPIPAGARVLDIACGTGNLAIPAGRRGAVVTAVDIAANLLEQGRARAAAERLDVSFEEANAEMLPYPDGQFDIVMALFGAMFAPRPERVAAEIARVCRPGGTILMANWTAQGFIGKLFALDNRYMPAPAGAVPAVLWGEEDRVRERLGSRVSTLQLTRRLFPLEFPFGPSEVARLFVRCFGPTIVILSKLDDDRRATFLRELEALWRDDNEAGDDRTRVQAEYLEVIATRNDRD